MHLLEKIGYLETHVLGYFSNKIQFAALRYHQL